MCTQSNGLAHYTKTSFPHLCVEYIYTYNINFRLAGRESQENKGSIISEERHLFVDTSWCKHAARISTMIALFLPFLLFSRLINPWRMRKGYCSRSVCE